MNEKYPQTIQQYNWLIVGWVTHEYYLINQEYRKDKHSWVNVYVV